jgi:hypothetical protein
VNLSGVVLARRANKGERHEADQWLSAEHAQHVAADISFEYPLLARDQRRPLRAGAAQA